MLKTGENESISDDAASVVTVVAKDDLSEKFTKLDLEDPDDCCSDDAANFVTADEFSTKDEKKFELTLMFKNQILNDYTQKNSIHRIRNLRVKISNPYELKVYVSIIYLIICFFLS